MINDNSCYSILNCIVIIEIIKMVHYESKHVFLSDCHYFVAKPVFICSKDLFDFTKRNKHVHIRQS